MSRVRVYEAANQGAGSRFDELVELPWEDLGLYSHVLVKEWWFITNVFCAY